MNSILRIFKRGNDVSKSQKNLTKISSRNPEEVWEIIGELGDGAFGTVYKVSHRCNL